MDEVLDEDRPTIATSTLRQLPVPAASSRTLLDRGWVVIEANAAWDAGLNGCDAFAASRFIARATRE